MANGERTILVVSDDAALCAEARRELESKEKHLRISAVSSVDAARRVVEDSAPAVILFEEKVLAAGPEASRGKKPRLDSVVATLAGYAPVVVIGAAEHQPEVAALVAAGAADYVARTSACLPVALGLVERRLHQANPGMEMMHTAISRTNGGEDEAEEFGEVLRHELNNPLTGILGNAELLLAEVRRKNDGRLPQGAQQRLETIAALAVRMREMVRRLSQHWETR
jgi:DNA-binding NarL/FixJ family response regulator